MFQLDTKPYTLEDVDMLLKEAYKNGIHTNNQKISYYNIVFAFDIETTSFKEKPTKTDHNEKRSVMYIWQLAINGRVIIGRTWSEFLKTIDHIQQVLQTDRYNRIIIYVHSLAFEFQYIRKLFKWHKVFAIDKRKPIYAITEDGIEFRCSYILTNYSLAKLGEQLHKYKVSKLVGDLDYRQTRHDKTPLTEEEEAYCYNDVRGLSECISEYMKHDSLAKIPMTSTGFVRRDFRKGYAKNKKLRGVFKDTALDENLYNMCKNAFRGGDTHANLKWGRQTVHDVHSFDIKSSYPACMIMDRFPMGKFIKISPRTFFNRDMSEFALLIRCRFIRLRYVGENGNPYLPFSRCEAVAPTRKDDKTCQRLVLDNGRIMKAEIVQCTLTDIDLEIMKREYEYDDFYVKDVWASYYGSLPQEFKNTLMDYFRAKTALDGDPSAYYEYAKAKNKLNSAYGMMVTDIAKPTVTYINGDYKTLPVNLGEALEHYYKSRNSFLSYQHGVWVTANARYRLRRGLWLVGADNVYDDTDSIKCRNDHSADFKMLNEENEKKALDLGAYAEAPDGSVKILGTWEEETPPEGYQEFRTLGAKKYIVKTNDHYFSTIAGVSKKAGEKYFNDHGIESFEIGTVIKNSGHLVAYYNDDQIHRITVEGCTFTTAANIALIDDTYTIGVTGEYLGLLENALAKKADIV